MNRDPLVILLGGWRWMVKRHGGKEAGWEEGGIAGWKGRAEKEGAWEAMTPGLHCPLPPRLTLTQGTDSHLHLSFADRATLSRKHDAIRARDWLGAAHLQWPPSISRGGGSGVALLDSPFSVHSPPSIPPCASLIPLWAFQWTATANWSSLEHDRLPLEQDRRGALCLVIISLPPEAWSYSY